MGMIQCLEFKALACAPAKCNLGLNSELKSCLSERAIISMLAGSSKKHLALVIGRKRKRGTVMESLINFNRLGVFICLSLLVIVGADTVGQSQPKSAKRVAAATKEAQKAAQVFTEIMNVRDHAIPQKLLDKAEAIAVFPGVIKAGFI